MPQDLEATLRVLAKLNDLGIFAIVVGSLASTILGEARFTRDADLLARIDERDVRRIVLAFERDFYISQPAVAEAVKTGSCFNLIDLATAFKVDIFVAASIEQHGQLQRSVLGKLPHFPEHAIRIASAEDVVVSKLHWYRLGGHVSDQQWRDVVGVIKARRDGLDLAELRRAARALGVADLAERAMVEGGAVTGQLF